MALPVSRNLMQQSTNKTVVSGSDRVFHVDDVSIAKDRGIVLDITINPSLILRLDKLAGAYQRIKYHRLVFKVTPYLNTATNGGYVAAFVPDANDKVPETNFGLSKLTSQQHHCVAKWWQNGVVSVGQLPDLYYTSPSVQEMRWYSPGRFVLMCDGTPSQRGSLTISLDWHVTLSEPSLEGEGEVDDRIITLQHALWMKAGEDKIWCDTDDSAAKKELNQNIRLAIPSAMPGDTYVLNGPIGYLRQGNAIKDIWQRNFWYMKCYNEGGTVVAYPYVLDSNEKLTDKSNGDTEVALKGSAVVKHIPQSVFLRGLQYVCSQRYKDCYSRYSQPASSSTPLQEELIKILAARMEQINSLKKSETSSEKDDFFEVVM